MAKSVRNTTGKVSIGRDAATGRFVVTKKAGFSGTVLSQGRGAASENPESLSPPVADLRPQTVVVKQGQPPVAASGDETYDISVKAAEDVFARFDWTLAELAK
ncbi:MAG: hypothetical protein ACREEJ_15625 [Ensifer adhaerens]